MMEQQIMHHGGEEMDRGHMQVSKGRGGWRGDRGRLGSQ
jgi:hypothetical protein